MLKYLYFYARVKINKFVVIDQSNITTNNGHNLLIWLKLRMTVLKWDDISMSNMMISCKCCIRLNHLNTVRCPYNSVDCLQNPHNRHSTGEIWCCGSNCHSLFATVIVVSYVISLYHTRTSFIFMCVNSLRPSDAYLRGVSYPWFRLWAMNCKIETKIQNNVYQ